MEKDESGPFGLMPLSESRWTPSDVGDAGAFGARQARAEMPPFGAAVAEKERVVRALRATSRAEYGAGGTHSTPTDASSTMGATG